MSAHHFDVLVVGGGSGLTAAHEAQAAGKSVAIVEKGPLGGTCVNRGCIPSKGLIESANVMRTIHGAGVFGVKVDPADVEVDFPAILQRVRDDRAEGVAEVEGWIGSVDAFTLVRGQGRFTGEKTLTVELNDDDPGELGEAGGQVVITADTVILAAGARAAAPPIEGLDQVEHLDNISVFELTEQPERLLVLGGGYIGAEMANFFSHVGTDVTVVEALDCLLREDHDVRSLFTQEFSKYVTLYNGFRATKVERDGGNEGGDEGDRGGDIVMTIENEDGKVEQVRGDALLVAVGRRPNTDLLDLEQTGVETNERGFIEVDEHLRTTHADVWAYGDIIGQAMFKHTSGYEGRLVWRNIEAAGEPVDYRANPHAIFSYPEIGAVGLTEGECEEQGLDFRVGKADYDHVAKGVIKGSPPGFAKLIVENGTDRILGFHIVGPGAADLVAEVVVAMTCGDGTVENLRRAIHVHPTMPELVEYVTTLV